MSSQGLDEDACMCLDGSEIDEHVEKRGVGEVLTERHLTKLAGNTISVPVVGGLWALLFSSIEVGVPNDVPASEVPGQTVYYMDGGTTPHTTAFDVLPGMKVKSSKRKKAVTASTSKKAVRWHS